MAETLIQCPFCGGSVSCINEEGTTGAQHWCECDDPECIGFAKPYITHATKREAANAWNTRALPSEIPVGEETLREAIDSATDKDYADTFELATNIIQVLRPYLKWESVMTEDEIVKWAKHATSYPVREMVALNPEDVECAAEYAGIEPERLMAAMKYYNERAEYLAKSKRIEDGSANGK